MEVMAPSSSGMVRTSWPSVGRWADSHGWLTHLGQALVDRNVGHQCGQALQRYRLLAVLLLLACCVPRECAGTVKDDPDGPALGAMQDDQVFGLVPPKFDSSWADLRSPPLAADVISMG
jgi:hypothetical protein